MKKLTEMVSLVGQTETITAADLRKQVGEVLQQTSLGKTYIITHQGKPIATISQHESLAPILGAEVRRLGLAGS